MSCKEDLMTQLSKDFMRMFENGSQNDVTIKLEDGQLGDNKVVLSARSQYFATMLSNEKYIEGQTNEVDMSH